MTTQHKSIADEFHKYFQVMLANSEQLLNEACEVRFRVYCEEFKYEDPARFPDRRECDEYDAQSVHCVVVHRASGVTAGCVRMVPTLRENPAALLPFEKYCADSLDRDFIDSLRLDRTTMCEISRLAVDGRFRRRPGEQSSRYGDSDGINLSADEQRTAPFIAISAYLAATAVTDMTGRTNVFAMMEPFLPRLLKRSGLHFSRAGDDIDYHGKRGAYFIKTEAALASMRPDLRELYECVHGELFPNGPARDIELAALRAHA